VTLLSASRTLPCQNGSSDLACVLRSPHDRPCSIADLLKRDQGLAAYCLRCDRWSELPLADLVAQGKGSLHLPITVR
jgi:hypothetical protein